MSVMTMASASAILTITEGPVTLVLLDITAIQTASLVTATVTELIRCPVTKSVESVNVDQHLRGWPATNADPTFTTIRTVRSVIAIQLVLRKCLDIPLEAVVQEWLACCVNVRTEWKEGIVRLANRATGIWTSTTLLDAKVCWKICRFLKRKTFFW